MKSITFPKLYISPMFPKFFGFFPEMWIVVKIYSFLPFPLCLHIFLDSCTFPHYANFSGIYKKSNFLSIYAINLPKFAATWFLHVNLFGLIQFFIFYQKSFIVQEAERSFLFGCHSWRLPLLLWAYMSVNSNKFNYHFLKHSIAQVGARNGRIEIWNTLGKNDIFWRRRK